MTTTPVGGDAVQLTFEPSASEPVNTVLAQESQQIGKTGGRRDPRRRKRRGEPVHLGRDATWALLNPVRVQAQDVLTAARQQGVNQEQDMKYAIVERNGSISIIKKDED